MKQHRNFRGGMAAATLVLLVSAPGLADDAADRESRGPEAYAAEALKVEDFIGTLIIKLHEAGPYQVIVNGKPKDLKSIESEMDGKTLRIDGGRAGWRNWSVASYGSSRRKLKNYPTLTVSAPVGSALVIEDVYGMVKVGDLKGALTLRAAGLSGEIGEMDSASLRITGGNELTVDDVKGAFSVNIAGSGDLVVGDVGGAASISIAGAGDVQMGDLGGGLTIGIAGSGDVAIAEVAGPVTAKINGSGDVDINGGRADPLVVRINGSGDFALDGVAVNPRVSINGSGTVRLKSYEGKLRSSGNGDVIVGE